MGVSCSRERRSAGGLTIYSRHLAGLERGFRHEHALLRVKRRATLKDNKMSERLLFLSEFACAPEGARDSRAVR